MIEVVAMELIERINGIRRWRREVYVRGVRDGALAALTVVGGVGFFAFYFFVGGAP